MKNFSSSPNALICSVLKNRSLIIALTKREVLGRYRGSFLGIFWSFIQPAFMLAIYTFVFGVVFKSRWNVGSDSKTEFALLLFSGLMVFNFFSECITRSPGLILNNVNYVKKVIFPLEILPFVALGSALFHFIISLIVWLIAYLVIFGVPHLTFLISPLVIIPLLLFTLGFSWFFASLGVYFRDLQQFIGMLVTVLMFLSPIFYPVSSLPESYRFYLQFNPLTPVVEIFRQLLYFGISPDFSDVVTCFCVSFLVAFLGFVFFQKTRKGFADVL